MEDLKIFFMSTYQFYQIEIEVYGYTFTMWQIFLFGLVLTGVGIIITALFSGGEY